MHLPSEEDLNYRSCYVMSAHDTLETFARISRAIISFHTR